MGSRGNVVAPLRARSSRARSSRTAGQVAFAFKGAPPSTDGSEVFLDAELLEQGFNYKSVANGHAYPLFYDTLFVDLRNALTAAAVAARAAKLGLWAEDRSHSSLRVIDQAGLEQDGVVFPKLLRRLSEFRDLPSPTSPGSCPGSRRSESRSSTARRATSRTSTTSSRWKATSAPRETIRRDRVREREDREPSGRALARRLAAPSARRAAAPSGAGRCRVWQRLRAGVRAFSRSAD